MSSYYMSHGGSEQGGCADPGVVEEVIATRGRRVLRGAVVCDDVLSCYYEGVEGANDPYKSTVCMDHHVLSRMQDDLRRAEIRRSNPKSAIPPRCEEQEDEIENFLEAADALPEERRTLSRRGSRAPSANRRSADRRSEHHYNSRSSHQRAVSRSPHLNNTDAMSNYDSVSQQSGSIVRGDGYPSQHAYVAPAHGGEYGYCSKNAANLECRR